MGKRSLEHSNWLKERMKAMWQLVSGDWWEVNRYCTNQTTGVASSSGGLDSPDATPIRVKKRQDNTQQVLTSSFEERNGQRGSTYNKLFGISRDKVLSVFFLFLSGKLRHLHCI